MVLCVWAVAIMLMAYAQGASGQEDETWIERLRSDSPNVRSEAERRLRRRGLAARPALEKASRDADRELAAHARLLLRRIELRERLGEALFAAVAHAEDDLLRDDAAWTRVFFDLTDAWGRDGIDGALRLSDLPRLFPQAAVGATTPDEKIRVLRSAEALRLHETCSVLARWAGDPDREVQAATVRALAALGDSDPARLTMGLTDGDPRVRVEWVRAAGMSGSHDNTTALAARASDEDPGVRAAVAETLGRLGDRASLPQIRALLRDEDSSVRAAALRAAADLNFTDAIPEILPDLGDTDLEVRRQAALALGRLKAGDARTAILGLKSEDAASLRAAAAQALAELGGPDAVADLLPLLSDADAFVRATSARALGRLGSRKAFEPVAALLEDRVSSVREAALAALEHLDPQAALIPARSLLSDAEPSVATAAAIVLARGGRSDGARVLLLHKRGLVWMNALKDRATWRALQSTPCPSAPTIRELLEHAARASKRTLQWPPDGALERDPMFRTRIPLPAPPTVMDALVRLENPFWTVILDGERLRVVRTSGAAELWSSWFEQTR